MQESTNFYASFSRVLSTMDGYLLKAPLQDEDRQLLQQTRMQLLRLDPSQPPKDIPVKRHPTWLIYVAIGTAIFIALLLGIIIGTLAGPQ